MSHQKVVAVFDVGKTNKKLLLFNEQYQLVWEESVRLPETVDEDGFPCEDVHALTEWLIGSIENLAEKTQYRIAGMNFSAYGASFVNIDKSGQPLTPIYNYLKPYPEEKAESFYQQYGDSETISLETASPVLGNLNSGMLLYWIKQAQPDIYDLISCSLHLPQYLSYVLSGKKFTDITSVGCHTQLWNFANNNYHDWVSKEGLLIKFAPLVQGDALCNLPGSGPMPPTGVGLHDSSAALIPYLMHFIEPFVLISTGTWCISMNPFNDEILTLDELKQDCLCYLSYTGKPVKSSRLFAGQLHETEIRRIAIHFNISTEDISRMRYSEDTMGGLISNNDDLQPASAPGEFRFINRKLELFASVQHAYHQLMADIMEQQAKSLKLVLGKKAVNQIFVDGGFSKNEIYMNLLKRAFPSFKVAAASVPQSTAMGAALAIHKHWNNFDTPANLVSLKQY